MKKISAKRLKKLGGKPVWSSISKRSPIRKTNPKRKKAEFARCYHSKQRVEFIRNMPCSACGVVGYSENAHVLGNGGLSRKAGFETIAPLCGPHRTYETYGWSEGCHRYLHRAGLARFQRYQFPDFDPEQAARDTAQAYEEFCGSPTRGNSE